MLPKENRLKKRKDFETVFKGGFTNVGLFFVLKFIKGSQKGVRCAFVFPVKQERSAVQRNKAKRVFREAVSGIIGKIERDYEMIFIIRKEAKNRSLKEIREEVERVLKKNEIIK